MDLLETLLAVIGQTCPLTENTQAERRFKASGMQFRARAFDSQGLGHVSVMTASGFLGLMKMETLILNPFFVDAPIFSCDRIHAFGREILMLEMFDSLLGESFSAAGLEAMARDWPSIQKEKSCWYDPLVISPNLTMKGKKKDAAAFDGRAAEFLRAYLAAARSAGSCDPAQKRQKAAVYSEGLLSHGGPATDPVKKAMGEAWTAELFRTTLFGTGAA